uniref:Uncharacterized protein n=1 Tax=Kryptoperidinium triquetrum TaxID=66468 RepID=A8I1T8_KRYTR|nr:unknown [Heterocapsa triquetra]|mmetsp:Transcript_83828/g.215805  ORF Transcript_83828/g.215805 Transcript_83828/m.215805 type:complete len:251 (+) Transcript_83828:92-844(+)
MMWAPLKILVVWPLLVAAGPVVLTDGPGVGLEVGSERSYALKFLGAKPPRQVLDDAVETVDEFLGATPQRAVSDDAVVSSVSMMPTTTPAPTTSVMSVAPTTSLRAPQTSLDLKELQLPRGRFLVKPQSHSSPKCLTCAGLNLPAALRDCNGGEQQIWLAGGPQLNMLLSNCRMETCLASNWPTPFSTYWCRYPHGNWRDKSQHWHLTAEGELKSDVDMSRCAEYNVTSGVVRMRACSGQGNQRWWLGTA